MFGLRGMHLKDKHIEQAISIILRVPSLFVLDHWLESHPATVVAKSVEPVDPVTSMISPFVLLQAFLVILLPLRDLVELYAHYLAAALLGVAELLSRQYVKEQEHGEETSSEQHVAVLAAHVGVAAMTSWLLSMECAYQKAALTAYAVPVAARLASLPTQLLYTLHRMATVVTILGIALYCLLQLPRLLFLLRARYHAVIAAVQAGGITHAASHMWKELHVVPTVLLFWGASLFTKLCSYYHQAGAPTMLLLYALAESVSSPLSLAACCVAVECASRAILSITQWLAQRPAEPVGAREGLTMGLLSLQYGLLQMALPQRVGALSVILFIVLGSLLQTMQEAVEPALLALSAGNTRSSLAHVRVLLLCLFLLVVPLYMTVFLYQLFAVDFWTLVIMSTCALTSVQVLGSLTVYLLFLYDDWCGDWERLDDLVYAARAVTRVLEFLVALLVVGAGLRESRGTWLDALVLAVHCYYNVWSRLQHGWKNFLQRRAAVHRISLLPSASPSRLAQAAGSVCPICYAEMHTARVTPCSHLFHAACLRKWLYVQDYCPLCHAQVTMPAPSLCSVGATDGAEEGGLEMSRLSDDEERENHG